MSRNVPLLIGLDLGSSGVRALAFTPEGAPVAEGRAALATSYPAIGLAQQDPRDWWRASIQSLRALVERLDDQVSAIAGIGLTGQCPTFTCLDPADGPVAPGLLYQDNRAATEVAELLAHYGAGELHQLTGQAPSAFYIVPKLLWLRRHQPTWLPAGSLVVQPRDLVGWYLTGQIATDPTHAACTLAYDLRRGDWMRAWLRELQLDMMDWPEVRPVKSVLGTVTHEAAQLTGLPQGLPVVIGAADSIGAAYGAKASEPGVLCEVTGTSTCLHLAVEQPVAAYQVNTYPHVEAGLWYTEHGLNTTGAALRWLEQITGQTLETLIRTAHELAPEVAGPYFLPHLSGGERDDPARQGAFVGLEIGHGTGHLARAVFEGIAYALKQRISLLTDAGCSVSRMISCGGPARNADWAQIKADVLGLPVETISPTDTTAWGAARIAGETLMQSSETDTAFTLICFQPSPERADYYQKRYQRFCLLEELLTRENQSGGDQRSSQPR